MANSTQVYVDYEHPETHDGLRMGYRQLSTGEHEVMSRSYYGTCGASDYRRFNSVEKARSYWATVVKNHTDIGYKKI